MTPQHIALMDGFYAQRLGRGSLFTTKDKQMTVINTVFTESAEALLQGEDGLVEFEYSTYPHIGDTLTVRTSPNNKVLTFVCTARHFDFSKREGQELTIVLDSQP